MILTVSAINVLPWRLAAQEPRTSITVANGDLLSSVAGEQTADPQDNGAGEPVRRRLVPAVRGPSPQDNGPNEPIEAPDPGSNPFGRPARSAFTPPVGRLSGAVPGLAPARPLPIAPRPPGEMAPARFEVMVYELAVPEDRIADLDAQALEARAGAPKDLTQTLAAFGKPMVLLNVSASSGSDKVQPVAYVIRYLFREVP